jgi:hypothetical protein
MQEPQQLNVIERPSHRLRIYSGITARMDHGATPEVVLYQRRLQGTIEYKRIAAHDLQGSRSSHPKIVLMADLKTIKLRTGRGRNRVTFVIIIESKGPLISGPQSCTMNFTSSTRVSPQSSRNGLIISLILFLSATFNIRLRRLPL